MAQIDFDNHRRVWPEPVRHDLQQGLLDASSILPVGYDFDRKAPWPDHSNCNDPEWCSGLITDYDDWAQGVTQKRKSSELSENRDESARKLQEESKVLSSGATKDSSKHHNSSF